MFALASRNTVRQLSQRIKPIYCKHLINENVSISSNFSTGIQGGNMQQSKKLTKFEKRILVYNKNFPTLADVPDSVSASVLNKAKDWSRVRVSIWMIGATVVGCITMSYIGRQAAKRGEGLQKMNLEWHRQYNEQAKKAEADELAKKEEAEAAELAKKAEAEAAELAKKTEAEAAEQAKKAEAEAAEQAKKAEAEAAEQAKKAEAEAAEPAKKAEAEAVEPAEAEAVEPAEVVAEAEKSS